MSLAELEGLEADAFTERAHAVAELEGQLQAEKLLRAMASSEEVCRLVWINVNHPERPEQTYAHDSMISILGVTPAELPEDGKDSHTERVLETAEGAIDRQVIVPARTKGTAELDAAMHTHTPEGYMVINYFARNFKYEAAKAEEARQALLTRAVVA